MDLEELCQRSKPEARLALPVRPEADLVPCCRKLLALHPERLELILPMLSERFAGLRNEDNHGHDR